jgi:ribosome-associated translation inhibitor RaiA
MAWMEMGGTPEVRVRLRGAVGREQCERAVAKLRAACAAAPRPVLLARLALAMETNPSLERPAVAKASVDVSGRLVRAHVARPSMDEAVDLLIDRIDRNIRRLAERRQDAVHEPAMAAEGEWRHARLTADRPDRFPRPVGERELVRRKSYSVPRISPEEAAVEMDVLDHDFHLFTEASSGADCLIHRDREGGLALVSGDPAAGAGPGGAGAELPVRHAATMGLDDALAMLDETGDPFVAFVDGASGRLHVAYLRYDGHHGLLAPADET